MCLSVCVCVQGVDEGPEGLRLISDIIREKLEADVSVLMGANIANEVADEKFCETTIGMGPPHIRDSLRFSCTQISNERKGVKLNRIE